MDALYIFISLFISLWLTSIIYLTPSVIYRYGIKKQTTEPKKAKWIAIYFAIISMTFIFVIVGLAGEQATGGGAFLWGHVSYKILVGRKEKDVSIEEEQYTEEQELDNNRLYDNEEQDTEEQK